MDVHGSLSATGRGHGHGTSTAILLDLEGHDPEHVRPDRAEDRSADVAAARVPRPIRSAEQLPDHCESTGTPTSEVVPANERAWRGEAEMRQQLLHVREVVEERKDSGLRRTGPLPGGLNVARHAPDRDRRPRTEAPDRDPGLWPEWANLVALTINEENASGGRAATAPTNGAAGIIPAVLIYAAHHSPAARAAAAEGPAAPDAARREIVLRFLLTAGAIGALNEETAMGGPAVNVVEC